MAIIIFFQLITTKLQTLCVLKQNPVRERKVKSKKSMLSNTRKNFISSCTQICPKISGHINKKYNIKQELIILSEAENSVFITSVF